MPNVPWNHFPDIRIATAWPCSPCKSTGMCLRMPLINGVHRMMHCKRLRPPPPAPARVQALRRRGHEVVALLRPNSDPAACDLLRACGAQLFPCDVCDPASMRGAAAGAAAVVSCLGSRKPSSGDVFVVDKQAVINVYDLAAAEGVPYVVALGSFEGPASRHLTDISRCATCC